MKKFIFWSVSVIFAAGLVGCAPNASQLKKTISENPDILFEAIENNPSEFLATVNRAAKKAREEEEKRMIEAESEMRRDEFANPKKPVISENRAIKGNKNAPITIVEYSDFQCPFCRRGDQIVKEVMDHYGDKVRLVFKHYPIDRIHPQARIAAKYFEAVAQQNPSKAYEFKARVFEAQKELVDGERFLDEVVKKIGGIDLAKVKAAVKSEKIEATIEEDRREAENFGFTGTPGYLINGVSLKGAYPVEDFKEIIDKHLESSGS